MKIWLGRLLVNEVADIGKVAEEILVGGVVAGDEEVVLLRDYLAVGGTGPLWTGLDAERDDGGDGVAHEVWDGVGCGKIAQQETRRDAGDGDGFVRHRSHC